MEFFGGGYSVGKTICIIIAVVIVTLIIIAFLVYVTDYHGKSIGPGVKRHEQYYDPRTFRESSRTKQIRAREGNTQQITNRIERLTRELRRLTEPIDNRVRTTGAQMIGARTTGLDHHARQQMVNNEINAINRQIENDFMIAMELMEGDIVMNLIAPQQAMNFIAQAFVFAPHLQSDRQVTVAADRIAQEAANKAGTRIEAVNAAMKSSVVYNNDTQSSHDNKAIKDLRDIHEKLENSTRDVLPFDRCMTEMIVWIDNNKSRDATDKAIRVINTIANGAHISAINKKETEIFALMYSHCREFDAKHNANRASNEDNAIEALADALIDCVENNGVVCASGRTARVLNCLAGISDELGAARTNAALKDEIMHRMINEFNALVQQYKNNTDNPIHVAIANTYLLRDAPDVTDSASMQKWRDDVNAVIDSVLNEYQNRLTLPELQAMRNECRIYASI